MIFNDDDDFHDHDIYDLDDDHDHDGHHHDDHDHDAECLLNENLELTPTYQRTVLGARDATASKMDIFFTNRVKNENNSSRTKL